MTRVPPPAALGGENHGRACDVLYRLLFPGNSADARLYPVLADLSLASMAATQVDRNGASMMNIHTLGDPDPCLTELAARAWLDYVARQQQQQQQQQQTARTPTTMMTQGAFFMALVLHMGAMLPYATFGRVSDVLWARPVCREMLAMRCGVRRLREYVHAEVLDGLSFAYLVDVFDADEEAMVECLQARLRERAECVEFFVRELLVPRVKLFNGYTGEEFSADDWSQLQRMLSRQGRDPATELPEYNKPSQEQLRRMQCEIDTYYDGWKHFNLFSPGVDATTTTTTTNTAAVASHSTRNRAGVDGDVRRR